LLQSPAGSLIHALSHITGGGIEGNTYRVIPKTLKLSINWDAWERPAIFKLIQEAGDVPEDDVRRTLNLGVGLILVVDRRGADKVLRALVQKKEQPFVLGEIVAA
jgi:phosphoribosylformylglycinamidine cyclo-ligase